MKDNLEEGERVECDDGYGGANRDFTKSKSGIFHQKISKKTCNIVHARQESVNKQINQFAALSEVFAMILQNTPLCSMLWHW